MDLKNPNPSEPHDGKDRHCPECGGHAPETGDTIFGKPLCRCQNCDEKWHGDQTIPADHPEAMSE